MHRHVIALLLLGAGPAFAQASALSIDAVLSDTSVLVGDPVTVQVTGVAKVDGNVELQPPTIDGLSEISRSQSEGTSISWTNAGQSLTREVTITIEYQADKAGAITIPPFIARLGKYEAKSKPMTLQVKGTSSAPAVPAQAGQVAPPEDSERTLFVRYRVDRSKAYLGQEVLMDLEIFAQPGSAFSVEEVGPPPELDGFWREVVDQPKRLNRTTGTVAGKKYDVYRVWRVALFPLAAGKKVVPAAAITFSQSRSIFSVGKRIRRQTAPTQLDVLSLPDQGRPSDFSNNNVGQYGFKGSIDHKSVPAGKAVVLKLQLTGRGNVKNARLPEITSMKGFRVFPATLSDDVHNSLEGIEGSKTAEILLMPLVGGRLEIPSVEITVFDPIKGEYQRLTSESMRIAVEGDPAAVLARTVQPDEPAALERSERVARSSLRPLRFRSSLSSSARPIWDRPLFAASLFAPPLLFLAALATEMMIARARRDTPTSRKRAASRRARQRLSTAGAAAAAGDVVKAYGELREAILELASNKCSVALRGLTIEQIGAALVEHGADEALRQDVTEELAAGDHARFGMGAPPADLDRWTALMERLDDWSPQELEMNAVFLAMLAVLPGQNVDQLQAESDFHSANERALEGDLAGAIGLYRTLIDRGIDDPDVHFNLGNAYAQAGKPIDAIVSYERALRLSPGDTGIAEDLRFLRKKVSGREVPDGRLTIADAIEPFVAPLPPGVCGWIAGFANAVLFLAWFGRRRVATRRAQAWLATVLGVAALTLLISLAVVAGHWVLARDPRGVLVQKAELREGPHAKFKSYGAALYGGRVRVRDSVEDFVQVQQADGSIGWVPSKSVVRI